MPEEEEIGAYDLRRYAVLPIAELSNVDFDEICQTSTSVKKNEGSTKFIVEWNIPDVDSTFIPPSIDLITPAVTVLDHDEMKTEVANEEWEIEVS